MTVTYVLMPIKESRSFYWAVIERDLAGKIKVVATFDQDDKDAAIQCRDEYIALSNL